MALGHQAEKLAAALPPLLIDAERVAHSVYQGMHGRKRAGIGESFWQFRRYEAGDTVARIDWRQSARTDKVFVREREWEAAQTACLWADMSGSMRYASRKDLPTKADRAQVLMLALASLCLRGGENVCWLSGEAEVVRGKEALRRLALRLELAEASMVDLLPPAVLPRHSHAVLCSDFLMPPEQLAEALRRYSARKIGGVLLHILDPIEESFMVEGRVDVRGCEGEVALLLPDAAAIRHAYAERMAEHKARLGHLARSAGWTYLSHVTDASPQVGLQKLYSLMGNH
jgi:uncharacterized protein (DUF58 family)